MSLTTRLFKVSGSKIQSLYIADTGLQFSSNYIASSEDEFIDFWNKKLSLATKVEVQFEKIKSVTKEDSGKEIIIKYKAFVGIPSECEFSFDNAYDVEVLFNYLEKEQYFARTEEHLTPIKAVIRYAIGFVFALAFIIFCYYEAIAITNGTTDEPSSGKAQLFMRLIGFLGDKGVLALGFAGLSYIGYKIVTRFKNPPQQTKLLPPMG
ncbi:MAG: hypothetical protein H7068_00800 [Pedobacter sp.]|nr:hypothetical protein [Chitinophagaceae bacterium]